MHPYVGSCFFLLDQLLSDRVEERMGYIRLLLKVTLLFWIFANLNFIHAATIDKNGPERLMKNHDLKELWKIIYSNR